MYGIMKAATDYLVPDYYPDFRCKMGACRHACCEGWPVTISMKDYFRLLSVSCSPELRARLDVAMHVIPRPGEDEYAQILPAYDGRCRLMMEDGRCRIHAELGEDALADICRLFPRGVRVRDGYECSCANSCEAVVEIFLDHPEPLRFIRIPLDLRLPAYRAPENVFADAGYGQEIRLYYIGIMQDRGLELPERLMSLGIAMQEMEKALRADDGARIRALMASSPEQFSGMTGKPLQRHLDDGLEIARAMLELVDERSESVRSCGEEALRWFAEGGNSIERYHAAAANFEAVIPDWRIFFEHLLVNHMFFEQFPFQDRPVPVKDEFLAVCAVYTLLRFLTVCRIAVRPSVTEFTDVCAALFRLISHTAFDRFAADMLKRLGCVTPEAVSALISL